MKIMASGPITSWQIDEKQWKQEKIKQILFSWSPKSLQTVAATMKLKEACSLKEKQWQTLFSSLAQSCPTLWPHGLEHARLPCPSPAPRGCSNSCPLSRWCHPTISSSVIPYSSCLQSFPASGSGWRRLLRVPWTARRSNQSILKEISTEYSLEGLKLKLQHFGHLMWRTDSLEKTLMLKKKNLESLLKGRDVTLLSKVHRVKSVVFSVVMYEY